MQANVQNANEKEFRIWLKDQYDARGVRRYSDTTIVSYSYALRTYCREIGPDYFENLFCYSSVSDFTDVVSYITESPDYIALQKEEKGLILDTAIKLYQAFLENGRHSDAPEVYSPSYLPHAAHSALPGEEGEEFHYVEIPMTPVQKIYYGVPGTGKSYRIMKELSAIYPDKRERDAHCKRLLFHPSYTYGDFIGCIKPLLSLDKPLDYIYAAGPFALLLKQAFYAPEEKFYLVIEEINRGNAPGIFGDFFQLLDRDETGKSRYPIACSDLISYFSKDPGLKHLFREGLIWLPSNFNILATMNTADENIFVLDNAFKRRFALEYVEISFDDMPEEYLEESEIFAGTASLLQLFEGTPLQEYCLELAQKGQLQRNWPTFARLTNRLMEICNKERLCTQSTMPPIRENKKLGPYFVSPLDLSSRRAFLNKVVFYLKQDVFADSKGILTDTKGVLTDSLETVYRRYQDDNADLFTMLIPS